MRHLRLVLPFLVTTCLAQDPEPAEDPRAAAALATRAEAALAAGDWVAARTLAAQAIDRDWSCLSAHFLLGAAHEGEGDHEQAALAYVRASGAFISRGTELQQRQWSAKKTAAIEKARPPLLEAVRRALADGDLVAARDAAERAAALPDFGPEGVEVQLVLAQVYRRGQQLGAAASACEEALHRVEDLRRRGSPEVDRLQAAVGPLHREVQGAVVAQLLALGRDALVRAARAHVLLDSGDGEAALQSMFEVVLEELRAPAGSGEASAPHVVDFLQVLASFDNQRQLVELARLTAAIVAQCPKPPARVLHSLHWAGAKLEVLQGRGSLALAHYDEAVRCGFHPTLLEERFRLAHELGERRVDEDSLRFVVAVDAKLALEYAADALRVFGARDDRAVLATIGEKVVQEAPDLAIGHWLVAMGSPRREQAEAAARSAIERGWNAHEANVQLALSAVHADDFAQALERLQAVAPGTPALGRIPRDLQRRLARPALDRLARTQSWSR